MCSLLAHIQPHFKRKSKARFIFPYNLSHFTFHAWPIHRKTSTQCKGINFNGSRSVFVLSISFNGKSQMLHNFIDCMLIVVLCCFFVRKHAYEHMFFGMWPLLNWGLHTCLHAMHNAHCTYGQNLRFLVYFFLENCSLQKKFSIRNDFEVKTSIERICNDKASSNVCVFEVGGSKIWNNFLYKFG